MPTFGELGFKGFEPVGFFLVLAPAKSIKTDAEIFDRAIKNSNIKVEQN